MWYSIDAERLIVLHKHKSLDVVRGLVWLECASRPMIITDLDSAGSLPQFTLMELQGLHKGLCGRKFSGFLESKLRLEIAALADALEPTDCDAEELRRQMAFVKNKDANDYHYVKRANRPASGEALEALCAVEGREGFAYVDAASIELAAESRESRESKTHSSARQSTSERALVHRAAVTCATPAEGSIGAEIWAALDADTRLRDPLALQAEARARKWNTLTAILQLSQWKKHRGI